MKSQLNKDELKEQINQLNKDELKEQINQLESRLGYLSYEELLQYNRLKKQVIKLV